MATQAAHKAQVPGPAYAVASDFCAIFAEKMNSLYQLSLCLTADPAMAEKCFVSGLEDSRSSNRVFKDWAQSWARRTVIQNAVRVMRPTRKQVGPVPIAAGNGIQVSGGSARLAALLELPTFERFVFVMSVLEQLSDQDCKTLLGCSREDVVKARSHALKRLAAQDRSRLDVALGAGNQHVQRNLVAKPA